MYMPYTTNPHMPRLRMEAAKLALEKGWSTRQIARHTGFNQSTIVRWVNIVRYNNLGLTIPTKSSRPHSHANQLSDDISNAILQYRLKYQRCAEVIHYLMIRDGYIVSLSSVKRTIKRAGLTRFSKWKKWHKYEPRPQAVKPGILVQIDTIFDGPTTDRLYIYTLLDVCTRWAFAMPISKINTQKSVQFIHEAKMQIPFEMNTLQSDHGAEFSKHFTKMINSQGITHRYSRIRRPTDNGHLERFNRTIQEECLLRVPKSLKSYEKAIPEYLHYYNNERPHMALQMQTPNKVMQSY